MVSNLRELFRRGARDETFGPERGVISMLAKLEGAPKRSSSRPSQRVGAKRRPMTGSARAGTYNRRASCCAKPERQSLLRCAAAVMAARFAGTTRSWALAATTLGLFGGREQIAAAPDGADHRGL